MAATTALTVSEFLELPLSEGERCELVAGELFKMGNAGFRHERVKGNTIEVLVLHIAGHAIGKVQSETMYRLSNIDACQPDVSVLLNDQIPVPASPGLLPYAPALAVEIVSSEPASFLEGKVQRYLEKGSRTVLVLYPEQRTARIYEQSGVAGLVRGEELVRIEWLAGFAVPLARFFEGI